MRNEFIQWHLILVLYSLYVWLSWCILSGRSELFCAFFIEEIFTFFLELSFLLLELFFYRGIAFLLREFVK
jgi:hypothetical protein